MADALSSDSFVELEGCHNFRDLGGYTSSDARRVRRGLLFRSDGLGDLTPRDHQRVRNELGVRAVIDLRTRREAELDGPGALTEPPVEYHHVPLVVRAGELRQADPPESFQLDRYYLGLLSHGGEPVRAILELLAATDAPAVFHCAAGKDRTGVISAVLLGLLDVSDDQIIADYALSRHNLRQIRHRLLSSEAYREMLGDLPRDSMSAQPETMAALLERVREDWGSMRGYAVHIGVRTETVEHLRKRLLDGP